MSLVGFPLLLIPFAIYNIIVFLIPGVGFDAVLTRVALNSGGEWTMTAGDYLVCIGDLSAGNHTRLGRKFFSLA